jgi:hypothetical protein
LRFAQEISVNEPSLFDAIPDDVQELGRVVSEAIPRDMWAMPYGSVEAGREALQRLIQLAEDAQALKQTEPCFLAETRSDLQEFHDRRCNCGVKLSV